MQVTPTPCWSVTIPVLTSAASNICQTAPLPAALSWFRPHCICMRWLTNSTCTFIEQIWSCRYETSVLQSQPKKDWSAAAKHYRLAKNVYPSGDTCHPYLPCLQALFCCVLTLLLDLLIRSASCCNALSWVGFSAYEVTFV